MPGGVDADASRIYISDPNTNRIKVYDYNGNVILDFLTSNQSNDVAVDDNGNIYVLSFILNRVQVYNSLGQSQFLFNDQINEPVGIEIYNNKIYVANQGSGRTNVYDLNGNFESVFSVNGSVTSLRNSQDKFIVCNSSLCYVMDNGGFALYNYNYPDGPFAGVFDEDDNLYVPRWNIDQFSIHDGSNGEIQYAIDDPAISMKILGDKLFVLGLDLSIYDIVLTEGDPPTSPTVTYTAEDLSGNRASCTVDINVTDSHGYCCPDLLTVNYEPIDPTDYYASDSICSNGRVAMNTEVNFRSTVIKMDTSFQVNIGGVFQAINEDCNE